MRIRALTAILIPLLTGAPALGQETRADVATDQRLARDQEARPNEVGRVERAFLALSHERILDRVFDPPHGWFVRAGLPQEGAAPAVGPAWRASDPNRLYVFTVSSALSLSREWIGEATLEARDLVRAVGDSRVFGRASLAQSGRVVNDFWGLGLSSPEADRTAYRESETEAGGTVGVHLAPWFTVGTTLAWLEPSIRARTSHGRPITDLFDESSAPGLTQQPTFVRTEISLDIDYRDSIPPTRTARRFDQLPLAGASRGGRYGVSIGSYRDYDLERYSFRRTTVDLQQHVPFLEGYRVLAVRALAILNDPDAGQVVPFYLSPTYGGISIGRGYPTFRFRDRNLLALQAEYRYRVNPLMSGAVFVDSGQVASRAREFAWSRFRTTYGVGLRLGWAGAAALRLDLAFGGDHPTLVFGMGHAF